MQDSFPESCSGASGSRTAQRRIRSVLACIAAVLASFVSAFAQTTPEPAAQPPAEIVHVRIAGPLDVGTQSLLRRGIERAAAGPRALVVELDTPGGEMELMFKLATQLADAGKDGVLTIAWIHDRAYSAGALVALSCQRIYMCKQGAIGSAAVVQPSPTGGIQSIQDPEVAEKVTSAVRAAFRAFAESHHRPPALAEAMVDRNVGARQVRTKDGELRVVTERGYDDLRLETSDLQLVHTIAEQGDLVSLSGAEAVRYGLADAVADSMGDVLSLVGSTGANVVTLDRARSEDVATWLASVYFVLIGLGVMALIAEFKAPGFGFAGVVAILCFGLALFGEYLAGLADVPHLVAVGVGLVFVAVELFLLPGAVWPGAIGAALVFGGLAFAQIGPGFFSSPFGRELALDNALELLLGIAVAVVCAAMLSRFLPKTPFVGRMVLAPTPAFAGGAPAKEFVRTPKLGEGGVALTPLRPVGKVRIGTSDEIEARSSGEAIDAGTRVRVVTVEGLRAVVEPWTESTA
ncbi:MAG TPA: NfeD family protein [Planctomycetota bacterium]|nr:NfeD family protein [Planctomycetota bacterium]